METVFCRILSCGLEDTSNIGIYTDKQGECYIKGMWASFVEGRSVHAFLHGLLKMTGETKKAARKWAAFFIILLVS